MAEELLNTDEAARRLEIARVSFYQLLADSNAGTLVIRGQPVTIDYFQGGTQGQGRIRIEAGEVERLKELTRVHPQPPRRRRPPARFQTYPGITVPLGNPDGVC